MGREWQHPVGHAMLWDQKTRKPLVIIRVVNRDNRGWYVGAVKGNPWVLGREIIYFIITSIT